MWISRYKVWAQGYEKYEEYSGYLEDYATWESTWENLIMSLTDYESVEE